MQIFKGAVTEILTPFNSAGEVDFERYRHWLDFQLKAGVSGIFVNGLASEAVLLDVDEQCEIAEATVDHLSGRLPVIANICTPSAASAVRIVNGYSKAGVDAICITNPSVYPYSKQSIFKYFETVADATTLPVYVYNAPQSGYLMSPDLVAALKQKIVNVAGYKDSTLDIVHLQATIRLLQSEILKGDFAILSGSDGIILPTLQLGGVGIISLISAVFPRLIVDLCAAFFRGDYATATQLQLKTTRIREILKIGPFLAGYKFAAGLIGHSAGLPRLPLVDLTDDERKQIAKELQEAEMLD